jgi:hypothetical protein
MLSIVFPAKDNRSDRKRGISVSPRTHRSFRTKIVGDGLDATAADEDCSAKPSRVVVTDVLFAGGSSCARGSARQDARERDAILIHFKIGNVIVFIDRLTIHSFWAKYAYSKMNPVLRGTGRTIGIDCSIST